MRKFKFVILILVSIQMVTKADIIYSPYNSYQFGASLEWIYSYEFVFSMHNTISPWGGFGIVSGSHASFSPSLGTEMGFELRHYFKESNFKGFNIGLYGGFAYMMNFNISHAKIHHDFNSVGIVPGIKVTYKYIYKQERICEPYIGISNPQHYNLNEDKSWENLGIFFTLGFRVGINKIKD